MALFEYRSSAADAASQALKVQYVKLVDACMKEFPFIGMLKKKSVKASGRTLNHTIVYSPGGIGATDALTQMHKEYETDASSVECTLPWKKYIGYKSIDALQLENMESSEGSYIDGTSLAMEHATKQVLQRAEASLLSRGAVNGYLSRVYSGGGTATIVLGTGPAGSSCSGADPNAALKFTVGQYVTFTSDATGGTSAATLYITAIDPIAGTISVSGSGSGTADNDYIFSYGDASGTLSALLTGKWMPGVFAWSPIPTATATRSLMTGDSYVFGCDRSVFPTKLAGWYYYGAGESSREEVLIKAISRGNRINGARTTHVVMNPSDLTALIIESQGRLVIQDNLVSARNEKGPIANVGFEGVNIFTTSGKTTLFTSSFVPPGVSFAYNDEVIHLKVINKEFPFIDDRAGMWTPVEIRTSGGGTLATTSDLDRYQLKAKGYCTFAVDDPSQIGTIVLPTTTLI